MLRGANACPTFALGAQPPHGRAHWRPREPPVAVDDPGKKKKRRAGDEGGGEGKEGEAAADAAAVADVGGLTRAQVDAALAALGADNERRLTTRVVSLRGAGAQLGGGFPGDALRRLDFVREVDMSRCGLSGPLLGPQVGGGGGGCFVFGLGLGSARRDGGGSLV